MSKIVKFSYHAINRITSRLELRQVPAYSAVDISGSFTHAVSGIYHKTGKICHYWVHNDRNHPICLVVGDDNMVATVITNGDTLDWAYRNLA